MLRLIGSTYSTDIRTICAAEERSGHAMRDGMAAVSEWVHANLKTPEGNLFYSSLADTEIDRRADRLRREASALHIPSCPMLDAYDRLAVDARHRGDMERMCSWVTFPGFAELDDDARIARLEDWIDSDARSPRTKELAEPLRLADPAERAEVLRAAARQSGLLSCDLAKTLGVPRAGDHQDAGTSDSGGL